MRWATMTGAAVAAVMAIAIIYGFASGNFGEEASAIMDLSWGRVSLIDLYAGLALFAAWVAYRERALARTLVWIALLGTLGNLAAGAYVALAAARSGSDPAVFFLGRRASD